MTTATDINLQKKYTAKERSDMLKAYIKACGAGNRTEAHKILEQMPIHPRWARIIADVAGKNFLVKNFNITAANEVYGEDWLDGR